MDNKEFFLKLTEVAVSSAGVLAAFAAGAVAYMDYSDKARQEDLKTLHDEQLKVCQDVSDQSAKLFSAQNQTEFNVVLQKFTELKHGKALDVLPPEAINSMILLYNEGLNFHSVNIGVSFQKDVLAKFCNMPFDVVLQCRKAISAWFQLEDKKRNRFGHLQFLAKWLGLGNHSQEDSKDLSPLDDKFVEHWVQGACSGSGGPTKKMSQ